MNSDQTRYQRNLNTKADKPLYGQAADSIDFRKFLILLKKSLIWFVLFIGICVLAIFLYIRYTNLQYKSTAELKLNKRNEASLFGFPTVSEESSNLNSISGEVELIRSKLFLREVVKQLPLNVKYELIGRFKNEERFKFIPFRLVLNKKPFINTSFYVEIVDEANYVLKTDLDDNAGTRAKFGQKVEYNNCSFLLEKTSTFFADQTMLITIKNEEHVLDYLEENLQVAPENLSANTIKIAFYNHNPHKVHDIVRTISEMYTEYSRAQKNRANQLKITFLDTQLAEIEAVLQNYEAYIESFTLKNKTIDPESDLAKVIDEIIKLDSMMYSFKFEKANLEELNEELQKDTVNYLIFNSIRTDKNLSNLLLAYQELSDELTLARMRYKGESQLIDETSANLTLIEDRLEQAISFRLEEIEKRIEQSVRKKKQLLTTFNTLPGKSNELNQKMRFYSIYEELYLTLMQKKTEFQIAKAGTLAEVVILTPANLPRTPIGPSSNTLYLSSVALGIILCFFFLLIRYLLYDEINGLSELEKLTSLPIVGSINRVRSSRAKKNGVLVFDKPRSQISENFRSLRTGLNFMGLNKSHQTIAVTSSVSGEGKTFVAVNLAAVLSLSKKKTIILDLDMRKPRTQYAFNIENNDEGISAILSGNANWADCVHQTQNENLHLIPSGVIPPNPAELLESDYFNQLLTDLKATYDVIILDTPPIGLVSDGLIALKKANHSLFVIRSDYSKRSFIKDLHRNVELNNIDNISLIFNAAQSTKKSYGYYQDYYDDPGSKSISTLKRMFNIS